jgi:hypothetical protein
LLRVFGCFTSFFIPSSFSHLQPCHFRGLLKLIFQYFIQGRAGGLSDAVSVFYAAAAVAAAATATAPAAPAADASAAATFDYRFDQMGTANHKNMNLKEE